MRNMYIGLQFSMQWSGTSLDNCEIECITFIKLIRIRRNEFEALKFSSTTV